METKKVVGFKAFDKDMKCRGFQFEVGKTYKHDGEISPCNSGFHFCENPLDVWGYYDMMDCTLAKVEATGEVKTDGNKSVTGEINITASLSMPEFIVSAVKYIIESCKSGDKVQSSSGDSAKLASSGDYAKLASSGDYAQLASSGDYAKLASSGDSAKLEVKGEKSVAANIGTSGTIKGKVGTWITLAEYNDNYECIFVKSAKIDGKRIKADTWYKLQNKKFVEAK